MTLTLLDNKLDTISLANAAAKFDAEDPLRGYRKRFHFPQAEDGTEAIYFTGNSLGLMPKTARAYIEEELNDWEKLGVNAHMQAKNPWMNYHEFLTERMAAIVGAQQNETIMMNSLTVNLHFLLVSFYRPTSDRFKIIIEKSAFPSDQYAIKSHIRFHGYDSNSALIELTPRIGESTLRTEDIVETIEREGDSVALVMLGGVNYLSGQAFDMKTITAAGHKAGSVVGFDLAHAAGNIEIKLHDWDVDFAPWCSYKYLNGGPGAIGGAFIHERHANAFDLPRFAGWWGHDKETRFLMGPDFQPIPGAEGWQTSNPAVLPMAALRASLEIFEEAGMTALIEKSHKLTGYLENLIDGINSDRISILTPRDSNQRGCQISIGIRNGDKSLHDRLIARGVFADWREPGVIRAAPAPLYNSFTDVFRFAEILKECLV